MEKSSPAVAMVRTEYRSTSSDEESGAATELVQEVADAVEVVVDSQCVESVDSSEGEHATENANDEKPLNGKDISVSRVKGFHVVAPPVSDKAVVSPSRIESQKQTGETEVQEDDGDAWETVEVRGRSNRKKAASRSLSNVWNDARGATPGKRPKGARTAVSRRKVTNRKVAREIVSLVLDKVEDEVMRKKPIATRPAVNPWKVGSPLAATRPTIDSEKVIKNPVRTPERTMRDVVMKGLLPASPKRVTPVEQPARQRFFPIDSKGSHKREQGTRSKTSPTQRLRMNTGTPADQNTAPTYQETVSAVSTPSHAAVDSKEGQTPSDERISKIDSNSDEAPQNQGRTVSVPSKMSSSRDPPLPTLLSPENGNSTTSSVASSLEVPHGSHRHHHSNCSVDVNDVGYHLLDVCDRLSSDMSLFMSRRELALSARRRERSALLAALQDIVSSIWPGSAHAELYGSCTTQLDLPSSDVDVVVVGLDHGADMMAPPQPLPNSKTSASSLTSFEEPSTLDEPPQAQIQSPLPAAPYSPLLKHFNAERVVRLAAGLEAHPWAVQVNAIPTASVPVVKVLADPSRLNGNGTEWMSHHQHLAAHAEAVAGPTTPGHHEEEEGGTNNRQQFHHQQGLLPWRGADVMNGLLSLDVTFEGPEHGGIGSTEFSTCVVEEACREYGLDAEATPLVQVVLVLKELLVQRRLNEPYSGGLSSYALLLLVVALIRERAVIKEELERVEQQRRAMAASATAGSFLDADRQTKKQRPTSSGTPSALSISIPGFEPKKAKGRPETKEKAAPVTTRVSGAGSMKPSSKPPSSPNQATRVSSWASIAKKQSNLPSKAVASKNTTSIPTEETRPPHSSAKPLPATKKPSFADAVARSANVATASPTRKKTPQSFSASQSTASTRAAKTDWTPQPTNESSQRKNEDAKAAAEPVTVSQSAASADSQLLHMNSYFSQGFNDIVEVLCSGETTAGKLLMHFLLYYGEHFDAQVVAIDISGKHDRGYSNGHPYPYISPYIQRRAHGNIDPVTGMLTVDPIVIYDPLEGAENNNVARRCFAWNSVKWIFAQSYATLSSAVERSATPPASAGGRLTQEESREVPAQRTTASPASAVDAAADLLDKSSPLLRCLLSF